MHGVPRIDAVIFGGGIAGLWTLDALVRHGRSAILIETRGLGAGQTIWSQGILHGGVKYSLKGMATASARAIRDMPTIWRMCLAGRANELDHGGPDLSDVRIRSEHCWLWQTDSLSSRLGMLGARLGLRTAAEVVPTADRPPILRESPGAVARLDEQVIDAASLVRELSGRHTGRIARCSRDHIRFERDAAGWRVKLDGAATVHADHLILLAGAGNTALRVALHLDPSIEQIRPLRMVMARGQLAELYGHCTDGAHTRVTITTAIDASGRTVWQIGGAIAEQGVRMEDAALIAHARAELRAVLPNIDLGGVEWSTYDAPRAEGRTPTGLRPEGAVVRREGAVITGWPTKLVLAPRLAEEVCAVMDRPGRGASELKSHAAEDAAALASIAKLARPEVALPPWDDAARVWTG